MKVWIDYDWKDERYPDYRIFVEKPSYATDKWIPEEVPEDVVNRFIKAKKTYDDAENELEQYLRDDF